MWSISNDHNTVLLSDAMTVPWYHLYCFKGCTIDYCILKYGMLWKNYLSCCLPATNHPKYHGSFSDVNTMAHKYQYCGILLLQIYLASDTWLNHGTFVRDIPWYRMVMVMITLVIMVYLCTPYLNYQNMCHVQKHCTFWYLLYSKTKRIV